MLPESGVIAVRARCDCCVHIWWMVRESWREKAGDRESRRERERGREGERERERERERKRARERERERDRWVSVI